MGHDVVDHRRRIATPGALGMGGQERGAGGVPFRIVATLPGVWALPINTFLLNFAVPAFLAGPNQTSALSEGARLRGHR